MKWPGQSGPLTGDRVGSALRETSEPPNKTQGTTHLKITRGWLGTRPSQACLCSFSLPSPRGAELRKTESDLPTVPCHPRAVSHTLSASPTPRPRALGLLRAVMEESSLAWAPDQYWVHCSRLYHCVSKTGSTHHCSEGPSDGHSLRNILRHCPTWDDGSGGPGFETL